MLCTAIILNNLQHHFVSLDWYTDSILCLFTFMVFSLSMFIFQTLDRRHSIFFFAEMCHSWNIFVPSAMNIIILLYIDPCTTAFHWSYPKFDNFSTRRPILFLRSSVMSTSCQIIELQLPSSFLFIPYIVTSLWQ